jgi:hypothetical protein
VAGPGAGAVPAQAPSSKDDRTTKRKRAVDIGRIVR